MRRVRGLGLTSVCFEVVALYNGGPPGVVYELYGCSDAFWLVSVVDLWWQYGCVGVLLVRRGCDCRAGFGHAIERRGLCMGVGDGGAEIWSVVLVFRRMVSTSMLGVYRMLTLQVEFLRLDLWVRGVESVHILSD